tara:strand:- start:602942 stop:603871 length:930 start_codon:yes stop_codon:yes gene_type:complete
MSTPNQHGRESEHSVPSENHGRSESQGRSSRSGRRPRGSNRSLAGKSIGGIAVLALVGLYAVAQPIVNERMGWNLPELRQGSDGRVTVVDDKGSSSSKFEKQTAPQAARQAAERSNDPGFASAATQSKPSRSSDSQPGTSPKATATIGKGPLADRMRPSVDSQTKTKSAGNDSSQVDDGDLLYGLLKEIGSKRYVSPAGLLYTPGSAEGHRLEHLRRHTKDQPSRPGNHGVFDGDMAGALKTIDKAYQRAKKGQRTTKSVDDGRTIYTVDMGSRVGFVGGRDGGRKRNPMARRVRLILEGTRVITAYPM